MGLGCTKKRGNAETKRPECANKDAGKGNPACMRMMLLYPSISCANCVCCMRQAVCDPPVACVLCWASGLSALIQESFLFIETSAGCKESEKDTEA